MAFQSTVNINQAVGVQGELHTGKPHSVDAYILDSDDAAYNIIGATAFTQSEEGKAAAGGTDLFAGILVSPKEGYSLGTTGGSLAATMTLPNDIHAQLARMGEITIKLPAAAAIGDLLVYNTTTGALSTVAAGSGSAGSGKAFVPNAKVKRYTVGTGGGLAVVELNLN